MAKMSKSNLKIAGLVLTVIGIGLAVWGYQLSGSFSSQMSHLVTGSHTDKVMTLYIGGAASLVAGLFLLLRK